MTQLFRKNRDTLAKIFALAWPAMLEQMLSAIVQYADSAMVGRLGAEATAAVGVTTPVGWLVGMPLFAMGIGFLACISQSLGAKDEKTARIAAQQSLFFIVLLGAAVGAVTLAVSPYLPGWLHAEEKIRPDASAYFSIVCLPMLFRASSAICGSDLRAAGDTRTPMRVGILMNGINVVLNLLLIFPTSTHMVLGRSFTLPGFGLGVRGAAVATAVSYTVGGTLMFLALLRNPVISPRGMKLRLNRPVMRRCVRVAVPATFSRLGMGLGYVVFLAQVSSLGTIPLAAHSLAVTAEEAVYLPGYGMQAAASTLAGNAVGAGDDRQLKLVTKLNAIIAALMMTVTGGLLFLFPDAVMRIFTKDARVIASGASVLRIIAVTEPIYAVGIILEGTFSGIGDTKGPLVINMITMWGIRIVFSWLVVHVLHGTLEQVWLCMAVDNVTRVALFALRFVRRFRGKNREKTGFLA